MEKLSLNLVGESIVEWTGDNLLEVRGVIGNRLLRTELNDSLLVRLGEKLFHVNVGTIIVLNGNGSIDLVSIVKE